MDYFIEQSMPLKSFIFNWLMPFVSSDPMINDQGKNLWVRSIFNDKIFGWKCGPVSHDGSRLKGQ